MPFRSLSRAGRVSAATALQAARCTLGLALTATLLAWSGAAGGQQVVSNNPPQYGPYNASVLGGGDGLRKPLRDPHDTVLLPDSPWTLSCWFRARENGGGLELLAGLGDVSSEYPRFLALEAGKAALWMGTGNEIAGAVNDAPSTWHLLTATFDGKEERLYHDGILVASGSLVRGTATPVLQIGPPAFSPSQVHFSGQIASFVLSREALSPAQVKQMGMHPPDFAVLMYEDASKPWPIQTRQQAGYRAPQDPTQMPVGRGSYTHAAAIQRPPVRDSLSPGQTGQWTFADGWTMREEAKAASSGEQVSRAGFDAAGWMRATVPGTVLTTLVDDGVYPDPDYGLNNLLIPETLNKQSYWYRNEFTIPAALRAELAKPGAHAELGFEGINYSAEVWLNGTKLGAIKGAFLRGKFDVAALLRPEGKNILAVRIAPPPHPGIPQEQSILGGPGENGGTMELDGPTFLATEGWDWIPAIRDRDSGIWQPVTLTVTHEVKLGDVQVITTFPQHDYAHAAVTVNVPLRNASASPIEATVELSLESAVVRKTVSVAPGESVVKLTPAEFPVLNIDHPRLWWPNGYGKPDLYHGKVAVLYGNGVSDSKDVRFGMREVSYELSLLDARGKLQRVEFTPAAAYGAQTPIVDVSHAGMREIPSADAAALQVPEDKRGDYQYRTVVSSLAAGAEKSPAIRQMPPDGVAPYLAIKVNGVRIAARGGNWGMDDARKRVSRERLEPYFRLHRDANLNIIRNWVGQSTEETFYELADEYGLMVWNDFWESTQDYNAEAEDPALFLRNASDVIRHFRNHPSIILWCGRNEGVPQPILNQGLEELVRSEDGTRFYSPSSNQVNLQQSGPYSYQDPSLYYTVLNRGFSVETGTPSMSTLESFESTTPKEDRWPIDDVWAYHDWHASGNGRTEPFMTEMEREFGAPTGLEDFERKAQMLDYVDHRAIFEGMNANLWKPNSGRMLWMTQPAWPSTMWQILSSDYDTQASFYGTKKACEPVHVQMNLATGAIDIVNTTREALSGLTVQVRVSSLATGAVLFTADDHKDVPADDVVHSLSLQLAPWLQKGVVLVELTLHDSAGNEVSRNLYWLGEKSSSYRELAAMPSATLQMKLSAAKDGGTTVITAELSNTTKVPALNSKLTLLGPDGQRILPAYFSDNYVSLLPGEKKTVRIEFAGTYGKASVAMRGWNLVPGSVEVKLPK